MSKHTEKVVEKGNFLEENKRPIIREEDQNSQEHFNETNLFSGTRSQANINRGDTTASTNKVSYLN